MNSKKLNRQIINNYQQIKRSPRRNSSFQIWAPLVLVVSYAFMFSALFTSPASAQESKKEIKESQKEGQNNSELFVTYSGTDGPGKGKKIVLISGDEEYRSEECLPQLGKILARHHGFECVVLFAIDPKDGTINPNVNNNIPGLENLQNADLMIIATRFRNLPEKQMKWIDQFITAGKPVIGMRTATHGFNINNKSIYNKYSWQSKIKDWEGGFGRHVLGETWISHHGNHGKESTRGIIAKGEENNPILRGIKDGDIYGPTDVYGVRLPLPGDSKPLILGQVLSGMKPSDSPVTNKKNDPMMPVVWTKSYQSGNEKTGKALATTMGAAEDLLSEGLRRLLVNGTYVLLGLESKLSDKMKVDLIGEYKPTHFGFGGFRKGLKPNHYAHQD